MIAAPPSEAGAVHDRLTWALPAVAVSPVGGPGLSTLACSPAAEVRTEDGPERPAASMAGPETARAARPIATGKTSQRRGRRTATLGTDRPGRIPAGPR